MTGKATDETIDSDKQIVDLKWAGKALEEWLASGGNMRVMHNPQRDPAGVGISLKLAADGATIASDIFEPTAMKLVKRKALRAFSVGISEARIVKDVRAPGGRIVGGQIVEVSLVDRPANPNCQFNLVKAIGGESVMVNELVKDDEEAAVATKSEAGNDDAVLTDISDQIFAPNDDVADIADATQTTRTDRPLVDDSGIPQGAPDFENDSPETDEELRGKNTTTDKEENDETEVNDDTKGQPETVGEAGHESDERTEVATKSTPSDLPQNAEASSVVPTLVVPPTAPVLQELVNVEPASTTLVHTDATSPDTVASWAMRRLHDITCPAYSTEALKSAYATIAKDGLSAALGAPARGMLFQLLQEEVSEDAGTGAEAHDISEIAKAYNALDEFLFSESMEDATEGITTTDFALAARETLRKGAKIEDSADPAEAMRTKSGRVFYGDASPMKTVHDVITKLFPSVCTLDADKAITVSTLTKDEGGDSAEVQALITKAATEQTQAITTKYEVDKAELVKAHDAELVKLNAKIEELSQAPQLTVTTTGGKAPSRALRGEQLNKTLAVETVEKREQDRARSERVAWLRDLAHSGDPRHADAAQTVLTQLGAGD